MAPLQVCAIVCLVNLTCSWFICAPFWLQLALITFFLGLRKLISP
jgi:hypothetical protein